MKLILYFLFAIASVQCLDFVPEKPNQIIDLNESDMSACSLPNSIGHRVVLKKSYLHSSVVIRQTVHMNMNDCSSPLKIHFLLDPTEHSNSTNLIVAIEKYQTENTGIIQLEHSAGQEKFTSVQMSEEKRTLLIQSKNGLIATFHKTVRIEMVVTVYTKSSSYGKCPRGKYSCGNSACIWKRQVCDGVNNCGNEHDEGCHYKWTAKEIGFIVLAAFFLYFLVGLFIYLMIRRARQTKEIIKLSQADALKKCHLNLAFNMKQ